MMILSALVFVTLAFCIHDAAGHHIREEVYSKMCDTNSTFKDGLVKCFNEMPRKDKMILKFCGSVIGNETIEDFDVLVKDICKERGYGDKVLHCMDTVTHMIFHLDENSQHNHDDDGHHHFDFGHGVYNEECFSKLYEAYGITSSKEDHK